MNKLKTIFYSILGTVVAFVFGLMYYFKHKEDFFQTKLDSTKSQKQIDLIETEIVKSKTKKDIKQKELLDLDEKLQQIQKKRKVLDEEIRKETDPEKISQYWNQE